jgi:hypothetical protein
VDCRSRWQRICSSGYGSVLGPRRVGDSTAKWFPVTAFFTTAQPQNRRFELGLRPFMCMTHVIRQIGQLIAVTFGVSSFTFAVKRWLWYSHLPGHADARICGNCFMAAVGIPSELALMGAADGYRGYAREVYD